MHFLIDANMPRSTASLLASYGHRSTDVRDIGVGRASDERIAEHARSNGLCILTGDWDFSDIRVYPPEQSHGIAVIGVNDRAMPEDILNVVRILLDRPEVLSQLPGRLAIVEEHKIRLRPAP